MTNLNPSNQMEKAKKQVELDLIHIRDTFFKNEPLHQPFIPLPQKTEEAIGNLSVNSLNQIDNFRYRFEIAPWYGSIGGKANRFFTFRRGYTTGKKPDKQQHKSLAISFNPHSTNQLLSELHAHQTTRLQTLFTSYVRGDFTPTRGLITGYGEPSVYNAGLRLHHTYGFPYLPAESIQGMVRTLLIDQLFEKDETKALSDKGFKLIFGDESGRGLIDFCDTLPISLTNDSIQPEVITNHFPNYYTGSQPPTDDQNPTPVSYLVVANTTFRVAFGGWRTEADEPIKPLESGSNLKTNLFAGHSPMAVVKYYLPKAFELAGVGARTKNGWGKGKLDLSDIVFNQTAL